MKNIYVILTPIVVFLVLIVVYYFYFNNPKKKSVIEQKPYTLGETLKKLNTDSTFLENADLQSIRPEELIEYFRKGLIEFRYSSDPKKEFGLKIEKDFPGENGRVILEIFRAYGEYMSFLSTLENHSELDSFEKWNEKIKYREVFFGKNLKEKLFPKKDSETIEKFFLYAKRYLKKHTNDNLRSKKIHLEKAKKEIYGEEYSRLIELEPLDERFELEWNIREQEIKIMTEKERMELKKEILDDLRK